MLTADFETTSILSRESMPFGLNLSARGIELTARSVLPKMKSDFILGLEKKKLGGFAERASALLAQFDILSVIRHRIYFVQLVLFISNCLVQNDRKETKNMYGFNYQLPCGLLYFMAVETGSNQVLLEFQDKTKGFTGASTTPLFRAYPIKASFLNECLLFKGGKKRGKGVIVTTLHKQLTTRDELQCKWSEIETVWKTNDWAIFTTKLVVPSIVRSPDFNKEVFMQMVCYLHENLIPVPDY